MGREERCRVVGLIGRSEVPNPHRAVDERRRGDPGIDLGPVLLQRRPRAVAVLAVRDAPHQHTRHVLRPDVPVEHEAHRAVDEPGVTELAEPVQIAQLLLRRGRRVPSIDEPVEDASELYPGASPYSRSSADVATVFVRLERLFYHLMRRCAGRGRTLGELREAQVGQRVKELA